MTQNNDLKAAFEANYPLTLSQTFKKTPNGNRYKYGEVEEAWEFYQTGAKFERERMIAEIEGEVFFEIIWSALDLPIHSSVTTATKAAQTAIVKKLRGE